MQIGVYLYLLKKIVAKDSWTYWVLVNVLMKLVDFQHKAGRPLEHEAGQSTGTSSSTWR